jgi:hypothetical protein
MRSVVPHKRDAVMSEVVSYLSTLPFHFKPDYAKILSGEVMMMTSVAFFCFFSGRSCFWMVDIEFLSTHSWEQRS